MYLWKVCLFFETSESYCNYWWLGGGFSQAFHYFSNRLTRVYLKLLVLKVAFWFLNILLLQLASYLCSKPIEQDTKTYSKTIVFDPRQSIRQTRPFASPSACCLTSFSPKKQRIAIRCLAKLKRKSNHQHLSSLVNLILSPCCSMLVAKTPIPLESRTCFRN